MIILPGSAIDDHGGHHRTHMIFEDPIPSFGGITRTVIRGGDMGPGGFGQAGDKLLAHRPLCHITSIKQQIRMGR